MRHTTKTPAELHFDYRHKASLHIMDARTNAKPAGMLEGETVTADMDLTSGRMVLPVGKSTETLPHGASISSRATPAGLQVTIVRPDTAVVGTLLKSADLDEGQLSTSTPLDQLPASMRDIAEQVLAHLLEVNDIPGLTGTLDELDKDHPRYAMLCQTVNQRTLGITKFAEAYTRRILLPPEQSGGRFKEPTYVAATREDAKTLARKPMVDGTIQSRAGGEDTKLFYSDAACTKTAKHGHLRYTSNAGCPTCQRGAGSGKNFVRAMRKKRPGFFYSVEALRRGLATAGVTDADVYRWAGELRWHGVWMPIWKSLHVLRDLAGVEHEFILPEAKSWREMIDMLDAAGEGPRWVQKVRKTITETVHAEPAAGRHRAESPGDHVQRLRNEVYKRERDEADRWDTLFGTRNDRHIVRHDPTDLPRLIDHQGKQPNLPRHPVLFFQDGVVQEEAHLQGIDLMALLSQTVRGDHEVEACRAAQAQGWASGLVGVGVKT